MQISRLLSSGIRHLIGPGVVLLGGLMVAVPQSSRAVEDPNPPADDSVAAAVAEVPSSHREIDPIVIKRNPDDQLNSMAMNRHGRVLASVTRRPAGESGPQTHELLFLDYDGRVVDKWDLGEIDGRTIHAAADGTLYISGPSVIVKFDEQGTKLETYDFRPLFAGDQQQSTLKEEKDGTTNGVGAADLVRVAGIATSSKWLFVSFGFGSLTPASKEDVYRFDRDFGQPKQIVQNMRGCCRHLDLEVHDNKLFVAENTRFRVSAYDFDGNLISHFGKRDRVDVAGFMGCCNPLGIVFHNGQLVTASSGIGRIKRYTPDGKFLGLAGYVAVDQYVKEDGGKNVRCYIPVEVSEDGSRIYVMDIVHDVIRLLQKKRDQPQ